MFRAGIALFFCFTLGDRYLNAVKEVCFGFENVQVSLLISLFGCRNPKCMCLDLSCGGAESCTKPRYCCTHPAFCLVSVSVRMQCVTGSRPPPTHAGLVCLEGLRTIPDRMPLSCTCEPRFSLVALPAQLSARKCHAAIAQTLTHRFNTYFPPVRCYIFASSNAI